MKAPSNRVVVQAEGVDTGLAGLDPQLRTHGDRRAYFAAVARRTSHVRLFRKRSRKATATLVNSSESLLRQLSAADVWNNAETAWDVHAAILLEAMKIAAANGNLMAAYEVPHFTVGSEFLASLNNHRAGPSGKFGASVREACARVVLGKLKEPAKRQFRPAASRSAGTQDEMRDGAPGMRVHLTKGHEALRLLFWQESKHVEFANIGVKGELEIKRGSAKECIAESLCIRS